MGIAKRRGKSSYDDSDPTTIAGIIAPAWYLAKKQATDIGEVAEKASNLDDLEVLEVSI
jgi:hypothetical protein